MKIEKFIEKTDFLDRCKILESMLSSLSVDEESDRVWMAVVINKMNIIIKRQDDPKGALEQVIINLRSN